MTDESNTIPSTLDGNPDKTQTITPMELQLQTLQKIIQIEQEIIAIKENIAVFGQIVSSHVKQNLEASDKIDQYVTEQVRYRFFRQAMDENNIQLELARKSLELEYMSKEMEELESEKKEGGEEMSSLRLKIASQELEIKNLTDNIALLRDVRKSTTDSMKSIKANGQRLSSTAQKVKDTVLQASVGTVVAAAVGGTIAFVIWLVRFYIENNP